VERKNDELEILVGKLQRGVTLGYLSSVKG